MTQKDLVKRYRISSESNNLTIDFLAFFWFFSVKKWKKQMYCFYSLRRTSEKSLLFIILLFNCMRIQCDCFVEFYVRKENKESLTISFQNLRTSHLCTVNIPFLWRNLYWFLLLKRGEIRELLKHFATAHAVFKLKPNPQPALKWSWL